MAPSLLKFGVMPAEPMPMNDVVEPSAVSIWIAPDAQSGEPAELSVTP